MSKLLSVLFYSTERTHHQQGPEMVAKILSWKHSMRPLSVIFARSYSGEISCGKKTAFFRVEDMCDTCTVTVWHSYSDCVTPPCFTQVVLFCIHSYLKLYQRLVYYLHVVCLYGSFIRYFHLFFRGVFFQGYKCQSKFQIINKSIWVRVTITWLIII